MEEPRQSSGSTARAHDAKASETAAAFEALARHPRLQDLVAVGREVLLGAAERRRADWPDAARVASLSEELGLSRAECDTPFGNVLRVLEAGSEDPAERAIAVALVAHVVAEAKPKGAEAEDRLASDLLWLAARASLDATPLFDRALGEGAGDLWTAIGDVVRRIDQGKLPALGRAEALVGGAALASSSSPAAATAARRIEPGVRDGVLRQILAASPGAPASAASADLDRVEGELSFAPRSALVTTLMAFTGLLLVLGAARSAGRIALAYRRPAELLLSPEGVRVRSRTLLLGRTLKERDELLPRQGLTRAIREVKFPSAGLYAGLLALAIGSYVGLSAFVDGIRSASPSLLLTGLVIVIAGIGLDFLLSSLLPGARGRCRVVLTPRTGAVVCLGKVDPGRADALLAHLSRKTGA